MSRNKNFQSDKDMTTLNVFDKINYDEKVFDEVEYKNFETFTAASAPTNLVNLTKALDYYDYDMESSHNTFFWDELLPVLIVYCLTFVLGLVGNVLIVFTISRYRKMKSTTNVFLASLASSDLLLILFCIPVKVNLNLAFIMLIDVQRKPGANTFKYLFQ